MKSLRAYEKIRDMILTGKKFPGSRLVLSELEEELGIGRGPIREAIMRLDKSGLVKNIPYKGAVVSTPPAHKEVLYIFDIRMDLESRLALAALERITDKDINRLEDLHDKMCALPQDHYLYDREFHDLINSISGMPHLADIAHTLIFSVEGVLNIYRRDRGQCERFNSEHRAIIDALKSNDPGKLKDAVVANIKSGLTIIEDTYSKIPQIQP